MALTPTQQIYEAWQRANRVLIAFQHNPVHDGAASALALGAILQKMNKEVVVVADQWNTPQELKFLPGIDRVQSHLEQIQPFIIEVDVKNTSMKNISHDTTDGKLRITLTPQSGTWKIDDVMAGPDDYQFDLICTVGAPDLESLGAVYHQHADFFYHIPIINIDHNPANEHYGQINHVDINATAAAEVLFNLVNDLDRHLIDEHVATHLLTGMISKTRSFKTTNVTPKTLQVASELVAIGARRDEIVHHLYRTRTVPVLRLWGRALARLKHAPEARLVWTMLSRQDFFLAGADASMLSGVIDELIINAPEAQCALILYEDLENGTPQKINGLLHAKQPLKVRELAKPFGGTGGSDIISFTLPNKQLFEAEPMVTSVLKEQLTKQSA